MSDCVRTCSFFCVLCALSALLLCPCPVVCALCLACPACGVAAWCCGCGVWVRPDPALPAPVGVCYGVPCTPCVLPALFSWDNTCPIYGGCYMRALYAPYICALFFLGLLFMIRSAHIIKSRPMDSEYGFPKVGLNFRCSVFHFVEFFPGKISGLIFP